MGMSESLEKALAALPDKDARDQAVIQLCRAYAAAIDSNAASLGDLGPKLQSALETLHMSPKARAAVKGGKPNDKPNPLDSVRADRSRVNGSPSVDPTSS